jgi:hypothetical protein
MDLNAFSKSSNIPATVNLSLSASNISFISLKEAFSVEFFLKPYCLVANMLFRLRCCYSLVYITFSRVFEKDARDRSEIGYIRSVFYFV